MLRQGGNYCTYLTYVAWISNNHGSIMLQFVVYAVADQLVWVGACMTSCPAEKKSSISTLTQLSITTFT